MKSVLITNDLWDVVYGDFVKPKADAELRLWTKSDQKALPCIILNLQPSQRLHVKSCSNSSEAWMMLKKVHTLTGPIHQVQLYQILLRLKMEENNNLQEHVNLFVEVKNKLAEVDIDLGDPVKVIMLLTSLPRSFEHFVVAMQTRDELPLFDIVKSKLLDEAERHKANAEKPESADRKAYAVHTKEAKATNYKKSNGPVSGQQRNGTISLQCWVCGQLGHKAAKCKQRNNMKKEPENSAKEKSYSVLCLGSNASEIVLRSFILY